LRFLLTSTFSNQLFFIKYMYSKGLGCGRKPAELPMACPFLTLDPNVPFTTSSRIRFRKYPETGTLSTVSNIRKKTVANEFNREMQSFSGWRTPWRLLAGTHHRPHHVITAVNGSSTTLTAGTLRYFFLEQKDLVLRRGTSMTVFKLRPARTIKTSKRQLKPRFFTTRQTAWSIISRASVCLSVCLHTCQTITFDSKAFTSKFHISTFGVYLGNTGQVRIWRSSGQRQDYSSKKIENPFSRNLRRSVTLPP